MQRQPSETSRKLSLKGLQPSDRRQPQSFRHVNSLSLVRLASIHARTHVFIAHVQSLAMSGVMDSASLCMCRLYCICRRQSWDRIWTPAHTPAVMLQHRTC